MSEKDGFLKFQGIVTGIRKNDLNHAGIVLKWIITKRKKLLPQPEGGYDIMSLESQKGNQ